MKKYLCLLLILGLLSAVGCTQAPQTDTAPETSAETQALFPIPRELPGVWVSASEGPLQLVETISFFDNGEMTVSGSYQDTDAGTIYGTYRVEGDKIFCDITDGTAPFQVTYTFRIDGRELILTDAEGDAHYLRTS